MMNAPVTIRSEKLGIDFDFHVGIGDKQVRQLIEYTQNDADAGIQNNTSDHHKADGQPGRFSSLAEYKKWLEKGRSIYTLMNRETGDLQGIVWFGKEDLPTNGNTFIPGFDASKYGVTYAIRTYGATRGAGVSIPFTRKSLDTFKTSEEYMSIPSSGIWLETDTDNKSGIAAYQKLGARLVSTSTANGRLIMVLPD
jgi:hypothetical protein